MKQQDLYCKEKSRNGGEFKSQIGNISVLLKEKADTSGTA